MKRQQTSLDLFEGHRIELASVKLVGDPDAVVKMTEHGEQVAYLVLGKVSEIGFPRSEDGSIVRRHKVQMSRIMQIDYVEGVEMLDRLDRKAREAEGIHELPFQEDTDGNDQ